MQLKNEILPGGVFDPGHTSAPSSGLLKQNLIETKVCIDCLLSTLQVGDRAPCTRSDKGAMRKSPAEGW